MPQAISTNGPMYAPECASIWNHLSNVEGYTVFVQLDQDGVRYSLVLTFVSSMLAATDLPELPGIEEGDWSRWLHVGVLGHGSYWFDLDTFLATGYVMEKLRVPTGEAAEMIAEFVARLGAIRRQNGSVE